MPKESSISVDERDFVATLEPAADGRTDATRVALRATDGSNERTLDVVLGPRLGVLQTAWINGERVTFSWTKRDGLYQLYLNGAGYHVEVLNLMAKRLREQKKKQNAGGPVTLKAPMPGTVLAVNVTDGQAVAAGDTLLVLEAMKMQNHIKADQPGTITALNVKAGQTVAKAAPLLTLTPTPAPATPS